MSDPQALVGGPDKPASRGEPLFRAPWPAVTIAGAILVCYALQTQFVTTELQLQTLAFTPEALSSGQWSGLFTSLFLHGGWLHAGVNAGFALAFGAPMARLFGLDIKGAAGFFLFYLVCGALANLGFAASPHTADEGLIGASGAVSGLAGGAARLIGSRFTGRLTALRDSTVVGMSAAWITSNLLIGVFGGAILSGGAPIAWQAHIAGYLAGLLLIGPVVALFRLRIPL